MNANTAIKINDAIAQAVECGESLQDIFAQVRKAASRALELRQAKEREEIKS